jgi:hypothetical protein
MRGLYRREPPSLVWVQGNAGSLPGRGSKDVKAVASLLGTTAVQPVTVKVADATLPLWRPLAWKVSFRPG